MHIEHEQTIPYLPESYQEITKIKLANRIIMDAISQKTKDYAVPEGNYRVRY